MKYLIRTRLAKEIIAEVALPVRQTGKVAILATGLPASPIKREVLDFFASKGYVAIAPRYRGTWESEGYFLQHSPSKDIQDIIQDLKKNQKIKDSFTGEWLPMKVKEIHLFGSSFGGPAVLLNSEETLVKKIVALCPVIDWSVQGPDEPFDFFVHFTQEAFGSAYRLQKQSDWQKLLTPHFYNPLSPRAKIEGAKVFLIQTKDDTVVPYEPAVAFIEEYDTNYYLKPKGSHLSLSCLTQKFYWNKIEKFLRD